MTKQTPFQKFEALAQQLIEGGFNRLLGGGVSPADIATELARVVENQAEAGAVPAQYEIRLNPGVFEKLMRDNPEITPELTTYLQTIVQQSELTLAGKPSLLLMADPAVGVREIEVRPLVPNLSPENEVTQIRRLQQPAEALAAEIGALDAYLIVDGQRHVPLSKPVISLGRSIENDVVLDLPTVSRQHAQIRWRYGRFVLYDISSRGRTQVNNQPVNESVLKSGDVISLSSVKLIYGEGETRQRPRPRPGSQLNDETQLRPPTDP